MCPALNLKQTPVGLHFCRRCCNILVPHIHTSTVCICTCNAQLRTHTLVSLLGDMFYSAVRTFSVDFFWFAGAAPQRTAVLCINLYFAANRK